MEHTGTIEAVSKIANTNEQFANMKVQSSPAKLPTTSTAQ